MKDFVTLGMFIVDEFEYYLDEGGACSKRVAEPQIGGGGTYAAIGARLWMEPERVGMIIDRGNDFSPVMQQTLDKYGHSMWIYREWPDRLTTRAINRYHGQNRGFEYLTERIRIGIKDLRSNGLDHAAHIHFICSPTRARDIMSEVHEVPGWSPVTIYEPIPDRCIPYELPALLAILPEISIFSPNAEEALSLLSMSLPVTKSNVQSAAATFLAHCSVVIIRCGELGAFIRGKEQQQAGRWIDAYWGKDDGEHIVDVTGAGNCFLGGLSAGLHLKDGDLYQAVLYGTISASFAVEGLGLPSMSCVKGAERFNGDDPQLRLDKLIKRMKERERSI